MRSATFLLAASNGIDSRSAIEVARSPSFRLISGLNASRRPGGRRVSPSQSKAAGRLSHMNAPNPGSTTQSWSRSRYSTCIDNVSISRLFSLCKVSYSLQLVQKNVAAIFGSDMDSAGIRRGYMGIVAGMCLRAVGAPQDALSLTMVVQPARRGAVSSGWLTSSSSSP